MELLPKGSLSDSCRFAANLLVYFHCSMIGDDVVHSSRVLAAIKDMRRVVACTLSHKKEPSERTANLQKFPFGPTFCCSNKQSARKILAPTDHFPSST
jgi:hypothetical protein